MNRSWLPAVLVLFALAACTPAGGVAVAEGGVRAWIDQPLAGSEYVAGETIAIRWHAAAVGGIAQVEVRVNGAGLGVAREFDHAAPLVTQAHDWTPPGPGEYLIQVIATASDGAISRPAEKRIEVVAGAAAGGSVSGAVYADLNADGDSDDAGEGPLAGVTVTLADCGPAASQITGADGRFGFEGLPPGTCLVSVDKAGWAFLATFPAGIGYPARAASDPALPTAFSVFMSTGAGGIVRGVVYADLNLDGDAQDAGEAPLDGVSVTLADCAPVAVQVTGADGQFNFTDLPAGSCLLSVDKPGWVFAGTFPAGIGYPARAASDPALPTAFSFFMAPVQGTPPPTTTAPPPATPTPPAAATATATLPPPATATSPPPPPPATATPPSPVHTATFTPLPPPTATPDTIGPPAPHIVGPAGGIQLDCLADVVLDWEAPYDPSGIANYRVRLQRWTGAEWVDQRIWDPVTATELDAAGDTDCGIAYRWRLLARDGAGNTGDVSEWAEFAILLP